MHQSLALNDCPLPALQKIRQLLEIDQRMNPYDLL
jgi:hypothetical protein